MFWDNYRKLCAERKKSPNAVAREIGIASGTITAWKNGRLPSKTMGQKVADFFGVSFAYIISDHELKNKEENTMKNPARPNWLADEEVEREIAELQNSEYVKLSRKAERNRYQRRQYLYYLRQHEKKGKALAEAGITWEMLEEMAKEASDGRD